MTDAECLAALVCRECDGKGIDVNIWIGATGGHLGCPDCNGTGRKYPTLRGLCELCDGQGSDRPSFRPYKPCHQCDGSGWAPDVTEGKLLEILLFKGLITISRSGNAGPYSIDVDDAGTFHHHGDTLVAALIAAVLAMEAERQGPCPQTG